MSSVSYLDGHCGPDLLNQLLVQLLHLNILPRTGTHYYLTSAYISRETKRMCYLVSFPVLFWVSAVPRKPFLRLNQNLAPSHFQWSFPLSLNNVSIARMSFSSKEKLLYHGL